MQTKNDLTFSFSIQHFLLFLWNKKAREEINSELTKNESYTISNYEILVVREVESEVFTMHLFKGRVAHFDVTITREFEFNLPSTIWTLELALQR